MSMTERALYLTGILALIISNSLMSIRFTEHYNMLLQDLAKIEKNCEKLNKNSDKKQCPL
jgi:hypothetical protein